MLVDVFAIQSCDQFAPSGPVCADIDDFQLKLVKLEGEFVWHHHDDEDELFLVKSGLYANSVPASSIFDPNGA